MKIFLAIVHAVLSCIQDYHVLYKVIRTAVMENNCFVNKSLDLGLDRTWIERYALAVKKDPCITVGHLP